jgi:hypothetical protein
MNNSLLPVAIYPSQLDSFKDKARLLSTAISEKLSIKALSAFKRNDYLSIALGYKGHPDLLNSSKFRKNADTEQQLIIFTNKDIRQSIAEIFSNKIPNITTNDVLLICEDLEKNELETLALTNARNTLEGKLFNFAKEQGKDIIPVMTLDFDELDNSPEGIKEREGAAEFLKAQEVKATPKRKNLDIIIDMSEVPMNICRVFGDHPQWLKFENEVKRQTSAHNVSFRFIEPKSNDGTNGHWKIRASIDAYTDTEVSNNLLEIWNEFSGWLMSFYATDRIKISQRIKGHRWCTLAIQIYESDPLNHQLSKLNKLDDITLFNLLAIREGYGKVFENDVADIDLNEVIKQKYLR